MWVSCEFERWPTLWIVFIHLIVAALFPRINISHTFQFLYYPKLASFEGFRQSCCLFIIVSYHGLVLFVCPDCLSCSISRAAKPCNFEWQEPGISRFIQKIKLFTRYFYCVRTKASVDLFWSFFPLVRIIFWCRYSIKLLPLINLLPSLSCLRFILYLVKYSKLLLVTPRTVYLVTFPTLIKWLDIHTLQLVSWVGSSEVEHISVCNVFPSFSE